MEKNHETPPQHEPELIGQRQIRAEHALIISVGAQGVATPAEALSILPEDVRLDIHELVLDSQPSGAEQSDPAEVLADFIGGSEELSKHLDVVRSQDSDPQDKSIHLELTDEGSVHFTETFYDTQDDDLRHLLMTILANNAPEHLRY